MIYKFNSRKHRRCHIVNEETGLTYCKAENGMTDLNETETFIPQQRVVCSNCVEARDGKQKKRRTTKLKNELKLNFYSTDAWLISSDPLACTSDFSCTQSHNQIHPVPSSMPSLN